MQATLYAQALYQATAGKADEEVTRVIDNLVALLRNKNHLSLLPKIAREYERHVRRKQGSHGTTLRVASESHIAALQSRIESDATALQTSLDTAVVVTDETAIGGYELRANGTSIDRTHKRTLISLYETLTNTA
jgi:F0F1-type ATP synthase delta subunit